MGKTKIAKKTTKKQTIPTPKCAKTQQKLVRKKRVRARNIVEKEEPKEPPRKTRAPGHLISPPINKRMLKPPVYPDSVDSETDQSSRESSNKLSFHHIKGTEHGRQPRTPPVGLPPVGLPPPQGYLPPPQGYLPPPQGYLPPPPQGYPSPLQGYLPPPSQGYAPPPQGHPQGYPPPPQGYPQGYPPPPPQGYPPQWYPSQGYPPQGYPPLGGYPRQYVPPQSHDKRNCPKLRNISSQDVDLTDGDDDDDDDDDDDGDDDFDSDDD